ncbi:MAG: hypothetical protein JXA54_02390 [Candidatus Heimdallarchaeota archaeon]|nr:hypothetical protein [Candidatus Heimdallarchaeota archaeon]
MTKKNTLMTIIGSTSVLLMLTVAFVAAPIKIGTVFSCVSADPTIDGKIHQTTEWKEGKPIDVKLFNLADQTQTLGVQIQSVYGYDNLIYFGILIPKDSLNPEDYFFMVFRTHETNPLVNRPYNADGSFGAENDLKFMWLHNNHSMDGFTKGVSYTWADDVSNGGVDNGIGKCDFNGTYIHIEMRFPFNSGDALGYDFNLYVNATIEMFLWFHDEDTGIDYTQIMEDDNDFQYLMLDLSCTGLSPLRLEFLFLGLLVVSAFSIIIKKRRN